ncbi:hypothetical protein [Ferruginibacter sp. SUN106]|uniref:hypothetical protein n=1 Tax=Ferruginibacter sp. SUN106 TaxID=2978348 RepID=UPI003D36CDCC
MKTFFTLLATIIFSSARADYGYMKLPELVCNADYGAVGTIVKIDKNYFYLKVDEYVLNRLDSDTLPISKFEDWPCGKRFDKYKVGQKEMVFFRKSNYVIDDYELLGYGGGDEFELPIFRDTIKYQSNYGKLESYRLSEFLIAIKDYATLAAGVKGTSKPLNKSEQIEFAKKSALHKLLIEWKTYSKQKDFEIPGSGMLVNLERNYIYEDYENKILISTQNKDSVYLSVEDADVWKQDNYFIVKPKSGWTSRWLNVYAINARDEQDVLLNQLFEVIELPEPSIYFGSSIKDTIFYSYYDDAIPTVGYYLDELHKDENLSYELLSYDYQIISGKSKEKFSIKSAYGTKEFQDRLQKLKTGDKIIMSNIFVLYPNNKVKQLKPKTVIIKME